MAEQCFNEKDSNPPICGVHKVRLIERQLSRDLVNEGYKDFMFLVCPVSGSVPICG
jgi:hypothetical protein